MLMASADRSLKLVNNVLPSRLLHTEEALHHWRIGWEDALSLPPASYRQKAWDLLRLQKRFDLLLSSTIDARSRGRLLAAWARESGA